MKLRDVAEVQNGLLKNRLITSDMINTFEYFILDSKQTDYLINDNANLSKVLINEEVDQKFLIKKNDIIIKLFPPFDVYKVDLDIKNLIAFSNFAIISPKSLNSDLLWFILKKQINKIQHLLEGSVVRILNLKILKEIDLDVDQDINKIKKQALLDKAFDQLIKLNLQKAKLITKKKEYWVNSIDRSW